MYKLHLCLIILVPGICKMAWSQSNVKDVEDYIHAAMATYGLPSLAFAVIKDDSILQTGAYGYADLERRVRATTQTIYPVASMDKQLTATAIMILFERREINLEDRVSQYLPDVPSSWNQIKIKHLLSHTSGIPDRMPSIWLKPISNKKLFSFIKRQKLLFEAGHGWEYSDAGFVLLQLIVEKISGQTYDNFQIDHILRPLGMGSTKILTPKLTHGRAVYYDKKNGSNIENKFRKRDRGPLYNDLGSTIDDFVKWAMAIRGNKLLRKTTFDLMCTPFALGNGQEVSNLQNKHELFDADRSYGFAWLIKKFNQYRIIYHSGYTGTSITGFPDEGLTVILFSNLVAPGAFHPDIVARHIAEFYLPGSSPYFINNDFDPHPKLSNDLQLQIVALQVGEIDRNAFNADFLLNLEPALEPFQEKLMARYGTLKSFDFLMEDEYFDKRWIVYRADFTFVSLYFQFGLDQKGQICSINVER